jgi:hypothetical protein
VFVSTWLYAPQLQAQSSQHVFKPIQPDRIVALWAVLKAGATEWVETTNLSPGADTVLHVWDFEGEQEIGFNDDIEPGNLASRVEVHNPDSYDKWCIVVMRARSAETTGTADLHASGGFVAEDLPVEGSRFEVPCATVGWDPVPVLETALQPNGAEDTVILAFGPNQQNLRGLDLDYGVGKASRVQKRRACEVIVGVPWTEYVSNVGPTALYVNDWWTDEDGDGLGFELEKALGTCDRRSQFMCAECDPTGCAFGQVFNLQDSDRDGLIDPYEVFGVDGFAGWGNPPQYLPKWGADPRHKDLFIQLDWDGDPPAEGDSRPQWVNSPMEPDRLRDVIAYFDEALAGEIFNPDFQNGLRVHIDAKWSSSNPADATLFGDWGSAGGRPRRDVHVSEYRDLYLPPVRHGLFRYGYLDRGRGGQANQTPGDSLWSGDDASASMLAHEMGHTVGISHSGHSTWGDLNCKPHYQSVMNYTYLSSMPFSHGQWSAVLNPADTDESDPGGELPSSFSGRFNFAFFEDSIDWNRDLLVNAGAIRAPITSGNAGCGAFFHNRQVMDVNPGESTPSVLRLRDRLYLFWVSDGQIRYRTAVLGDISKGSCLSDVMGEQCLEWGDVQVLPTATSVLRMAATAYRDEGIAVVYTYGFSLRTLHSLTASPDGEVTSWSSETVTDGSTVVEPEIAFIDNGYGSSSGVLSILYPAIDGRYKAMTSEAPPASGWTAPFDVLDDTSTPLEGSRPPSVTAVPSSQAVDDYCATFVAPNDDVRLYCLHPGTFVWSERTGAFAGTPKSPARATVSFHINRTATGAFIDDDPTNGYLHVITDRDEWYRNSRVPDLRLLRRVPGEGGPPNFEQAALLWFGNVWTAVLTTTSYAIYDDRELGATKAAIIRWDGSLLFFPFGDGTVRADLRDGNDFHIMERNLCRGLRRRYGDVASVCGDVYTSYWGY